ncbi:acyltransferase family protein [Pseudarthrobacter sulfonivorans]|uniref:acyltransferase family protein n=1 Tax=Pseudarthrobacter sulfonivorans TaxID=121292 RepID=UPI00210235F4|nr:acyltransferase [Pseudarthrobacter sulfonivorans]
MSRKFNATAFSDKPTLLPRDLPTLTSLRAFAALLVFIYHLEAAGVINFPPARLGYTGVAFFFVLSGFVLAWGYRPDFSTSRFYLRRVARVYPSHIAMWLVVLLLPNPNGSHGPLAAILNLLLLQAWPPSLDYAFSLNGVAWSLSCEIGFYAAFPLIVRFLGRLNVRAMWIVAFGAFAISSVFVIASSGESASAAVAALHYVNPIIRLPEFMLGVVAALAIRSGWRPRWVTGLGVIFLASGGFLFAHDYPSVNVWATLFYLVLIIGFVLTDIHRPMPFMQLRALIYAGKVSFCFYLAHQIVILQIEALKLGAGATVLASLGASCLLASVLHHVVEIPTFKWLVIRFGPKERTTETTDS